MKKQNKGITLIALVITIIVLLILAGVTINVLFGDNGILKKAQNAKDANIISQEKEYISLAWNNAYLKKALEAGTVTITANDMDKEMDGYGADAEQSGTSEIKIKYRDTKNVYYVSGKGNTVSILTEEEKNNKTEEIKYGKDDPTPGIIDKDDDGKTQLDGTEENPYRIQSIEDLLAFAYNVNTGTNTYAGKTIALDRNLDFNDDDSYVDATALYSCNENGYTTESGATAVKELLAENGFTPIGIQTEKTFTGIIDGKEHYLSNLLIKEASNSIEGYGLFGYIESDITIKNFGIESGSITGKSKTAGFIGKALNKSADNKTITIYNCYNKANVVSTDASAGFVGGVNNDSDYANFNLDIQNSSNYGNIEASNQAGGILGYFSCSQSAEKETDSNTIVNIVNCANEGMINSTNNYAAGIASYGYAYKEFNISNCINKGNITGKKGTAGILSYYYNYSSVLERNFTIKNNSNEGTISSGDYTAGIMAYIYGSYGSKKTIATNNKNSGEIIGNGSMATGGICAYITNETNFNGSSNTGNITVSTSNGRVGGIYSGYGKNIESLEECYNKGNITVQGSNVYVGGITNMFDSETYTIKKCYNEGKIEATGSQIRQGGIVGFNNNSNGGIIEECHNTGEIKCNSSTDSYSGSGGIVGYSSGSSGTIISGCYNTGNIVTEYGASMGGIIGYATSGTLTKNSYNLGDITSSAYAGGIVARGYSNVTNCYNEGNITGKISSSYSASIYVGGITACENGIIDSCYNKGTVTSENYVAGGIVGEISSYEIKKSHNEGNVNAKVYAGGIAGTVNSYASSSIMNNCYNTGDIESSAAPAGGILGYTANPSTINNSYNTGSITASAANAGGIIGVASETSTINNSYNAGDILSKSPAGGIAGQISSGEINDSYNVGTITATAAPAGGIAGSSNSTSIANCYNAGKITGPSEQITGGITGSGDSSGVTNCYYLAGTAKFLAAYNDGLGEKEEAEMKTTEFLNLLKAGNEESLWKIDSKQNNGMPILNISISNSEEE